MGGHEMQSCVKTALAAAALAAAAFCPGTAHAFTFPPGGGAGSGNFTVDDKLFSNFTCSGGDSLCGGASYIPAPGGAEGPAFNPGLSAGPGVTADVNLEFEASTVSGAASIADFFLTSNATFTGTGSVTDTLRICNDALCTSVIFTQNLITDAANPASFSLPDTILPNGPYPLVWIDDNVTATGGTAGSAALISSLDKIVTQTSVPEPASLAILAVSLLGMGAAFRVRRFRK
jgi:hypothetical protein